MQTWNVSFPWITNLSRIIAKATSSVHSLCSSSYPFYWWRYCEIRPYIFFSETPTIQFHNMYIYLLDKQQQRLVLVAGCCDFKARGQLVNKTSISHCVTVKNAIKIKRTFQGLSVKSFLLMCVWLRCALLPGHYCHVGNIKISRIIFPLFFKWFKSKIILLSSLLWKFTQCLNYLKAKFTLPIKIN